MLFLVSFFSKIMVVENEDLLKIVTSRFSKQPQSVNFDIYSISGQRIVTCTREDDSIREHYEVRQFIRSHWTTRWKTRKKKKDPLLGFFFLFLPSPCQQNYCFAPKMFGRKSWFALQLLLCTTQTFEQKSLIVMAERSVAFVLAEDEGT